MSYAGVEAQRAAESARDYARQLENDIRQMRSDYDEVIRELRSDIRDLQSRTSANA